MEHEGDGDAIYVWSSWNNPQRIGKSGDHPDDSIVKIGQNTEKSRGD